MVNKALKEYPIDTSKEKELYYYNFIEMDARQFAQNTLKEYNKKIPNMINPNV